MLSTLAFWVLLLSGLLVKGDSPCPGNSSAVLQRFEEYNISTTIQLPFEPVTQFGLAFLGLDAPPIQVTAGVQLTQNDSLENPQFALCSDSCGPAGCGPGPFVLAAVDPDLAPTLAQVRHFLGGGFYLGPESQGVHALVNRTPAITDYIVPQPPAGSGLHRYVFLLFKQPPGFEKQGLLNSSSSILQFNLSAFAEETGLGNPVGGTFFLVGADPTT